MREAAAATADEALDLGVIDVIAADVPDLLRQLDGRKVTVAGSEITLALSDAPVEDVPLSPFEIFLNTIVNPTFAAILLTLGLNALLFRAVEPRRLPGRHHRRHLFDPGVLRARRTQCELGRAGVRHPGVCALRARYQGADPRRAHRWRRGQLYPGRIYAVRHLWAACAMGCDHRLRARVGRLLRLCGREGHDRVSGAARPPAWKA